MVIHAGRDRRAELRVVREREAEVLRGPAVGVGIGERGLAVARQPTGQVVEPAGGLHQVGKGVVLDAVALAIQIGPQGGARGGSEVRGETAGIGTGVRLTSTGIPADGSREVIHGTAALASPAAADNRTRPSNASNIAPATRAELRRKPCCDLIIYTLSANQLKNREECRHSGPGPGHEGPPDRSRPKTHLQPMASRSPLPAQTRTRP